MYRELLLNNLQRNTYEKFCKIPLATIYLSSRKTFSLLNTRERTCRKKIFKIAEFGEEDRMLDKQGNANDGYDDNDDGDTTTPVKAEYSSTPGLSGEQIEITTMNRDEEKGIRTAPITLEHIYDGYGKNGRVELPPLFTLQEDIYPDPPKATKKDSGETKEQLYAKKGKKVEKKQTTLQEDYRIVDDENKDLAIRLRARERSRKLSQVCGISNTLDGTEDDAIYAEEFANAEDEEMDDEFDNDKD
ncbi:unnamed protein product, partial [Pocillopora meandrina]